MGFLDKCYMWYAIVVLIAMFCSWRSYFKSNTKMRVDFIVQAQKDGRYVPCKLSCFTVEGNLEDPYYKTEYVYVIDKKRYFVTYQIPVNKIKDSAKDDFDADILVETIPTCMLLFYDEKDPLKVMCKAEAFTSKRAMDQTYTNQNQNVHRDIDKDWLKPINLISR